MNSILKWRKKERIHKWCLTFVWKMVTSLFANPRPSKVVTSFLLFKRQKTTQCYTAWKIYLRKSQFYPIKENLDWSQEMLCEIVCIKSIYAISNHNFLILSILAPTFFWILYNKCTIINWLSLPINSFGTSALANSLTSVSHCCKLVKDFLLVTS